MTGSDKGSSNKLDRFSFECICKKIPFYFSISLTLSSVVLAMASLVRVGPCGSHDQCMRLLWPNSVRLLLYDCVCPDPLQVLELFDRL